LSQSEQSEQRRCPTCGAPIGIALEPSKDEQTQSDSEQTASDSDQTSSDSDQAASESDSESSAEDQDASDREFAAGGDPVLHEQTRRARATAQTTRGEATHSRGASASGRLAVAAERDRLAVERDAAAAERDRKAARDDEQPGTSAAERRMRAARDRAQAAADRERAAADREAAALERAEAHQSQARADHEAKVAATDELTGAWTRRFGLLQLERELERARRTGDTLVLAFIDVDALKEVNDSLGHAAGDRLLQLAADTMHSHLRPYDIVVRYGGDEFLCALPSVTMPAAATRLAEVAAHMAATETGHALSFGLADYTRDDPLESLVARADADLLERRRTNGHD
jgi:diguanylate cyclase (GGDEF)-like protein